MKSVWKKSLSVLIAAVTVVTISGVVMAGTVTNSYSFNFHNVDNFIGLTGADTTITSIDGLNDIYRTMTVQVKIQNKSNAYSDWKSNTVTQISRTADVKVGKTSDSYGSRLSYHKASLNDAVIVSTVWNADPICNSTYSATQIIP